jgi:uncharacterized protein (DUF2267 family)
MCRRLLTIRIGARWVGIEDRFEAKEVHVVRHADLLSEVQRRARLHGPNETRRAVCATLEALGDLVPGHLFAGLVEGLPAEIRSGLKTNGVTGETRPLTAIGRRTFVDRIARRLYIEQPDAAFLARVVFGELNATPSGITPSLLCEAIGPTDLDALLRSGAPDSRAAQPLRVAVITKRPERITRVISAPPAAPRDASVHVM